MTQITEMREVPVATVDWNDDGRIEVQVLVEDMTPESAVDLAAAITFAHSEATRAVTEHALRTRLDGLTEADAAGTAQEASTALSGAHSGFEQAMRSRGIRVHDGGKN